MTMLLRHDGAPGHVADATIHGWSCSCGAGTVWPDNEERPRSRATGGARRHLTAAARANPENVQAPAETPAEAPETPREADVTAIREAATNGTPATPHDEMTQAQKVEAAREAAAATRATVAEFRSPPRTGHDH